MSQNEKADEKQAEKQEEKSVEEKWGEKDWRRDRLSGTIWALVLIMAGVVLLLVSFDLPGFTWLNWDKAWGLILVGAALLIVLEIAIRMMMPKYASPLRGRIILASILAILGLDNLFDVPLWPLIIIAIGVSVLLRAFTGQAR